MTRTEQEQRATIERLLQLWVKHPELRLAQLILGGFRTDIYYLEDNALIESLEQSYHPTKEEGAK